MRKVHYRVVLDVLLHEDEEANGTYALEGADFFPEMDADDLDIIDVRVKSVGVTDSR
ncbi:hypothetical protein LCGC14_0142500 [marine sediment metagenome]|uniref:Uncharacterized protein n=1 Tax=marine sediment metagenome TaxID=412755 RepID=A0A0F9V193_9ZZZZ